MTTVLVVHALSYRLRRTTTDFVMCFGRYAPSDIEIVYHNLRRPIGPGVKGRSFDAVILTYDLLALRVSEQWPWVLETVQPLCQAAAEVIAMPQDDYTYARVLDEGLRYLGVDTVYTPISAGWDEVYPTVSKRSSMRVALTGYVDDATVRAIRAERLPLEARPIDVGQRVRMLPPWFGRQGQEKGQMAVEFERLARDTRLKCDISTDEADVFNGSEWYRFLGSSRATLGQRGGASLVDPDGSVMRRCWDYLDQNPDASFDEVEQACFPGLDGKAMMTAISPRLFDAATAGTAQILVEDDYLGVLEPWVHYIPTDPGLSNFDEVAAAVRDTSLLEEMTAAADGVLIESGDFTYQRFVAEVLGQVVPRRMASDSAVSTDAIDLEISEQLVIRLTPELFEGLQRCVYQAWALGVLDDLAQIAEGLDGVLRDDPGMAPYLDLDLWIALLGRVEHPTELRHLLPAFVDIFVECFRAGAGRATIAWMLWAGGEGVGEYQLLDWIDRSRIDLQDPFVA